MKTLTGLLALLFSQHLIAYTAPQAERAPLIDGTIDQQWSIAPWAPIAEMAIDNTGQGAPAPEDYQARYKVLWDKDYIYLLAEIVDDHLSDTFANPLDNWWNDDTLEIFIDADRSGGVHGGPDAKPDQEYNAFAYHIALDNQVVDVGPDANGNVIPQLFNDHVKALWRRTVAENSKIIWEARLKVYNHTWRPGLNNTQNKKHRLVLKKGLKLGFMVFGIDADGGEREHFIGSIAIEERPPHGKNWGWINADVFDVLVLD